MTRHGVFVRCASCGREFDPGVLFGCPKCGGTLVVRYEDEGRRRETLARFVREGHSGARIDWDPLG